MSGQQIVSRCLSLEREDLIVDDALLARLPAGLADYYLALPLASEDGMISVAMAHPENKTAQTVLSAVLGGPIVAVRARSETMQATIRRYYQDPPHQLMVMTLPAGRPLAPFLQHAPLLLLRGKVLRLGRVLIALRGYAADTRILDWLAPLLCQPATVTLLPLTQSPLEENEPLMAHNEAVKYHLASCLNHPALAGAQTRIRYRQGVAERQVVDELRQEPYDLLAISAEGYGQFVSSVLAAVEAETAAANTALFLLRPPAPWQSSV